MKTKHNFMLCIVLLFLFINAQATNRSNNHLKTKYLSNVRIDNIVLFGDSLTDNGNIKALLTNINSGDRTQTSQLTTGFINMLRDHISSYDKLDKQVHITDAINYVVTVMLFPVQGTLPIVPPAPYWEGRFSNGPVWSDYLSDMTQAKIINYAYGGSWIQTYEGDLTYSDFLIYNKEKLHNFIKKVIQGKIVPPSLGVEENIYFENNHPDNEHTLYIVWSGGNDYLNKPNNVNGVIDSLHQSIYTLIKNGAKNIVITNLPDMGRLPHFFGSETQNLLTQVSSDHDNKLAKLISQIQKGHSDLHLAHIDIRTFFNDISYHPEKYGFSNSTEGCISGYLPDFKTHITSPQITSHIRIRSENENTLKPIYHNFVLDYVNQIEINQSSLKIGAEPSQCDNPEDYVFWDGVHPSTAVHELIAQLAYQKLNEAGFII